MDGGAMVMGDLVVVEDEINPVMSKLAETGIEITALHNHLLRANPATFYLHVGGHGDPVKMATAIHTALTTSKTPEQTRQPVVVHYAPKGGREPCRLSMVLPSQSRSSLSISRPETLAATRDLSRQSPRLMTTAGGPAYGGRVRRDRIDPTLRRIIRDRTLRPLPHETM